MTNFCRDCVYYVPPVATSGTPVFAMFPKAGDCIHADVVDEVNSVELEQSDYLVTGNLPVQVTEVNAWKARRSYGICGTDGDLWEQKVGAFTLSNP